MTMRHSGIYEARGSNAICRFFVGLALGLAMGAMIVTSAAADVLTLEATRDNTLFEDAQGDTSNGSGPSLFAGRNSQGRARRALLAFDVRSALPAGAMIESVTLRLHLSNSSDPLPRAVHIHRALADWGEGASSSAGGGGAPAQGGDATWLHTYFPGSFWNSPGGDYVPAPSASTTVAGTGDWAWGDAQLTADVQSWVAEGGNYGWVVIGDESLPGTARRFDSRELATAAQRPRMEIHYSMVTRASPRTWGGLKYGYR